MESQGFQYFRKKLNKTQEEMAHLLGVSVKAVRSYEQGWRTIPSHVERLLLFLTSKKEEIHETLKPCWIIKKCKDVDRDRCPAWEFQAGTLCWYLHGTACNHGKHKTWKEKIRVCQNCSAFPPSLRLQLQSPQQNASSKDLQGNCFD